MLVSLLFDGYPRVFAFSIKRIEVGEILYINYGDLFKTVGFQYIKYHEPTRKHI
jgi:hypothetical protein